MSKAPHQNRKLKDLQRLHTVALDSLQYFQAEAPLPRLPGTNLIAALLAEAKGDHREAVKALNLLKRWRDVASADGALARVAELLPGVDIISFGLMVNHGHYAHAVRAICKTRWVEITATSSALALSAGAMEDWVIVSVDSDMLMQPRAASLAGGLLDVCLVESKP